MPDLAILGAGNLGFTLKQFVEDLNRVEARWSFVGFVDDAFESLSQRDSMRPLLGPAEWLASRPGIEVLVAIGSPASRKEVVSRVVRLGVTSFPTLVHPSCYVPSSVRLGRGTILCPGVCIDPGVTLGDFVQIGRNSNVGHHAHIADFSSVSPGCSIGGNVRIETGVLVGIGACIINEVRIGEGAVVGAGSAVFRDVAGDTTVLGVPARRIPRFANSN
jgi:sugar O-acyltransferase (sialic acid O-acetyltransferase NeuD family)